MNVWLTVLTGISDPELVFGCHSPHVVMCVDSCGAEEDAVGFAKTFPDIPCLSPNTWQSIVLGSAFPENGLAFRQDFEKVGKTQVDW